MIGRIENLKNLKNKKVNTVHAVHHQFFWIFLLNVFRFRKSVFIQSIGAFTRGEQPCCGTILSTNKQIDYFLTQCGSWAFPDLHAQNLKYYRLTTFTCAGGMFTQERQIPFFPFFHLRFLSFFFSFLLSRYFHFSFCRAHRPTMCTTWFQMLK